MCGAQAARERAAAARPRGRTEGVEKDWRSTATLEVGLEKFDEGGEGAVDFVAGAAVVV